MSYIEDLLMEAWELGIKDQVMEKVDKRQKELQMEGKSWIDRDAIYDQALSEAKKEMLENGSRN
jgi:hypothetical protein